MTELHDPDRVPTRLVVVASIIVVIAILASIGAAFLVGGHWLRETMRTDEPPAQIETSVFREQTEAERDRTAAADHLTRYGWVDRDRAIVHVPLEVAIELYLEAR